VDVVSEGGVVDARTDVEAIAHEGGRVVVRRLEKAHASRGGITPVDPRGGLTA